MSRNLRLHVQSFESREVPAGDLAYAVQLTGLPASAMTRIVGDPVGNTYITGTFSNSIDLNPDPKIEAKFTSKGGSDVFVAKYGYNGELIWARQLGGLANESAVDLALDGIGNIYVGGNFTGAADFNPASGVTANLSAAANGSAFIWKLDFGGKYVIARALAGTSTLTDIDVDPLGKILATGQFKGTADFDPSTTVAATLTTTNAEGSSYLWKLDQLGNYNWAKSYESTAAIQTSNVILDANGYAYLAGRFTGTVDLDPAATKFQVAAGTNWTPFVTKLGFSGDFVWGKTLQTTTVVASANNAITGLATDGMGNVYAAGTFAGTLDFDPNAGTTPLSSNGIASDGFVWKLTNLGNFALARRFGGINAETVTDLAVHPAGEMYLIGNYTGVADFDPNVGVANLVSGSGNADAYVLKLSSTGNLVYTRSIGGGASTTKATGLFADGAGNMYIAGSFKGVADFNPNDAMQLVDGKAASGFIAKLWPSALSPKSPTNLPPTNISAGGPYVTNEGDGLTVKATATDPEGKPLIYNWDLNGDGVFGDAKGWKIVLTPAQAAAIGLGDGTGVARTIRVRILDGVNLGPVATTTLTVKNLPPTAKINPPIVPPVEGIRPKLSFKVISDFSAKDLKSVYKASWDFNDDGIWDLGDGNTYTGSVAGETKIPMALVGDAGPVAVRVRVFDKDGGYSESTLTVVLAERPPTAMFSLLGPARVGMPVTFKFSNQQDAAADKAAGFKYAYDFNNDGVFEVQNANPQANATFPGLGTYSVRGAIIDQDGAFNVYQLIVNVSY